jgi:hypothetical protein
MQEHQRTKTSSANSFSKRSLGPAALIWRGALLALSRNFGDFKDF